MENYNNNDKPEPKEIKPKKIKPKGTQIVMNQSISNNFEFPVDICDTMFVLARNNSLYKDNVSNIISKIVIIKESNSINLDELSKRLGYMKIEKLNIFSINSQLETRTINIVSANKGSRVKYVEMNSEIFVEFLNFENNNFLSYNKDSLYIVRYGDYIDIKNLFTIINDCHANLCRGGSQKAHVLSPIDFKLSCYLMTMFNFNYKLISSLNTFNDLSKDRYLSYMEKPHLFKTRHILQEK